MESINNYLLELIFIRLPVKYILRIKCVCKYWNQIISSKSFCDFHLEYKKSSSNSQKHLMFDHSYSIYSANLVDTEACVFIRSNPVGRYEANLVAYFFEDEPLRIICLDLSRETIRAVKLPKALRSESKYGMKADGESIALIEYCSPNVSNGHDVVMWILRHSATGELWWDKKLSFNLKNSSALGFIDDDKVLVRLDGLNRLFMLLNLETSQFTVFKFQQRFICSETRETVTSMFSFAESLVLLDETIDPYCSSGTATFILDRFGWGDFTVLGTGL